MRAFLSSSWPGVFFFWPRSGFFAVLGPPSGGFFQCKYQAIRDLVRSLTPAARHPPLSALPDPRVFRSPGVGLFHFDFLLNFNENSKRVAVASKLVSRNVAGLLFMLSGQIYAITKQFSNSNIAKSLNRSPYERHFFIPNHTFPPLTPAARDPLTSALPDPRGA